MANDFKTWLEHTRKDGDVFAFPVYGCVPWESIKDRADQIECGDTFKIVIEIVEKDECQPCIMCDSENNENNTGEDDYSPEETQGGHDDYIDI